MPVSRHQPLYGQGCTNRSSPSCSNTSSPSIHYGACTPEPMFSSPIAECYANDAGLTAGSTNGHGPDHGYTNPRQGNPRARESCSSDRRQALFEERQSKFSHDRSMVIPGAPKNLYERTTIRAHRPLLSPIAFTPPTDASDATYSTGDSSCNLSAIDTRVEGREENRCAFPPPQYDTISREKNDLSNGSSWHLSRQPVHNRRHSMSLGEENPPSFPPRPEVGPGLHPTILDRRRSAAGSKELRRSAGSLSLNRNGAPWVGQIVEVTKRAGSYYADEDVNNLRVRPRLWLDATNREQSVAEAHIETVTRSPTKPRVIRISRNDSLKSPPKPASPAGVHRQQFWPMNQPATPPETPKGSDGVDITWTRPSRPVERQDSLAQGGSGIAYPYTPPNSRVPSPRPRSTVRHIAALATDPRRRDSASSGPCAAPCKDRSDRIDLIIGELEAAIHNHPTARLYLDSPVIQYVRLLLSAHPRSLQPPHPSTTPSVGTPNSRYSILYPLSSHPVTPEAASTCRGAHSRRAAASSQASSSRSLFCKSAPSPVADKNPTVSALRIIYPQAPTALLDSLQATYLALNYISSLVFAPPNNCIQHPEPPSPPASIQSFSSIPPKALATLGIPTPIHPPASSTSWLRPASPMAENRVDYVAEGTQKLGERSEDLQISLRILIRGLLGEIEGRRLARRDESLVRAVGEVVRCGENVSNGL